MPGVDIYNIYNYRRDCRIAKISELPRRLHAGCNEVVIICNFVCFESLAFTNRAQSRPMLFAFRVRNRASVANLFSPPSTKSNFFSKMNLSINAIDEWELLLMLWLWWLYSFPLSHSNRLGGPFIWVNLVEYQKSSWWLSRKIFNCFLRVVKITCNKTKLRPAVLIYIKTLCWRARRACFLPFGREFNFSFNARCETRKFFLKSI